MVFIEDSDLNGSSPQFTLTCTSIGGPATTVTWTRDTDPVTKGTKTNSQCRTHTLTVTQKLGGLYKCTVIINNRQSSAELNLTGMLSVMVLHVTLSC